MKNILLTLLVCFSLMKSNAQAPQGIPYQSVIRNGSGALLINQAVNVRFSIHDSTMLGTIVYQETHTTTTSNLGMITLSIGQGTPSTGTFSSINWGVNSKFMQVELDAAGGNNYIDLGTQQMMSVPYALYAGNFANSNNSVNSPMTMISTPGPSGLRYLDALHYCDTLVQGGYSDWRIPNFTEFELYVQKNGMPIFPGNSGLWFKIIPTNILRTAVLVQEYFGNSFNEYPIDQIMYHTIICIR
jgi:hypothetical protein